MLYRFLADVMVVLHGAFLLFFMIGGFLAWRWPRAIWAHLAVALWSVSIVIVDFKCPLSGIEKYFRRKGGEETYSRGFIEHYLEGRIWPEGGTPVVEKVGFALLVISYLGFFVLRRRSKAKAKAERETTTTSP